MQEYCLTYRIYSSIIYFLFYKNAKYSSVVSRIVNDELTCALLEKQYRASKIRHDSATKRIAKLNFYDMLCEVESRKKRSWKESKSH